MPYAIMRIEKRKLSMVTKINNHHERLKEEYKSNPDIDSSKSYLNYHLVKPKSKYRNIILGRIEEAGAKRRSDSVVMQDCLVTASPEWINAKSTEEQREFFNYAFTFFEKRFRKENIVSAVVHMDEANPHMHLCFVPITKDNRLSSKDIIGGPKGLSKMQDDFHEFIHSKYPDIDRGIPKRVTHRKHIPTYMFKVANELYSHYDEILNAINDIGMVNNSKKKDSAIALIGKYAPEMAALKDQLTTTDNYIAFLERETKMDKENVSYLKKENDEKSFELWQANKKLVELNRKQKELETVISKLPKDLLNELKTKEKQNKKKNKGDR